MTLKVKRTGMPPELEAAVAAHAAAIVAGDDRAAASWVDERAAAAANAAMARMAQIGPPAGCDVIAKARLGFHWIVKLRITGRAGATITLQNRWHRERGGDWRLIEVEDAGLRSPWKKPEQAEQVKADG